MRLVSLTTALLLVGCADQGDEGMVVIQNTAVGDGCKFSADVGALFIPRGQIYAGASIGYILTPLIRSRVTAIEGEGATDDLQRTIFLRSADVKLTLKAVTIDQGGVFMTSQPETEFTPFSTLFSGSLPPSGLVNLAFEVLPPTIISQIKASSGVNTAAGQNLTAEVLAEVTVRGEMGGDEVVATPFHYPISVCTNCVVVNAGTCPLANPTGATGNACNPFQDGVVECCTDASNRLVCPAI